METLELGMTVFIDGDTSKTGVIQKIGVINHETDVIVGPCWSLDLQKISDLEKNTDRPTYCTYAVTLDDGFLYLHDCLTPLDTTDDYNPEIPEYRIRLESDLVVFYLEINTKPVYFEGFCINQTAWYGLTIKNFDHLTCMINQYSLCDHSSCIIDPLLVSPGYDNSTQAIREAAPNLPDYLWAEMGRLLALN